MINEILSAIATAIYDEFGDGYEIYKEKIEQGLKEPCFFISEASRSNAQFLSRRYKTVNLFAIQYFPSTQYICEECNNVAERLESCLELIKCNDDPIRGSNLNSQFKDGILNVSVNYDLFTIKPGEDADLMDELNLTQYGKDE